jgi:hypothetical protein
MTVELSSVICHQAYIWEGIYRWADGAIYVLVDVLADVLTGVLADVSEESTDGQII